MKNFGQHLFSYAKHTFIFIFTMALTGHRRSMRKTNSCKKAPAGPLRWLARKIFFWPIKSGKFKCFWNQFGKTKCPGSSPCCSKLSPTKILSSRLAASGSPRMINTTQLWAIADLLIKRSLSTLKSSMINTIKRFIEVSSSIKCTNLRRNINSTDQTKTWCECRRSLKVDFKCSQ